MREEYDFSKGKRGLYSRDINDLHFPVYLEPDLEKYYKNIASQKNTDLSVIINSILEKEKELLEKII
ncbi:toxin-antitoxin system, antitoxin component [Leptospira bourretii]|uniref:toxin-antitoxin system, antitoxin component n=1 Tax=Leptospira bourretii TaxID=2484962 RepID=UPI001091003C|nr:toxin-antitoxin system, antitoxin component [Leptospira bourretii]TGL19724.1 toxin-antitoxin system, antitoxin component [Leptospira bourretii]